MSFWKRLWGRSTDPRTGAELFPRRFTLFDDLAMEINLRRISSASGPSASCWTYETQGLDVRGQKELLLILRQGHGEPPAAHPLWPLDYAKLIYRRATTHQFVRAGVCLGLPAPPDVMVREGFGTFSGFAHAASVPIEGVPGSEHRLMVIPFTAEEMTTMQAVGAYRILNRLGYAARSYPFPLWCERERASVASDIAAEPTLLSQVAAYTILGCRTYIEGQRMALVLTRSGRRELQEVLAQLPPQRPFAIVTSPEPTEDGRLVWRPGVSNSEIIGRPGGRGKRLSGVFISFNLGGAEDRFTVVEDGFATLLTNTSWDRLRRSIEVGESISLESASHDRFQLEFVDDGEDDGPLDLGRQNPQEEALQWRHLLKPVASGRTSHREVALLNIVFTSEPIEIVPARVAYEEIVEFGRQLDLLLARSLADGGPLGGFDAMTSVSLKPDAHAELNITISPAAWMSQFAPQLAEAEKQAARLPIPKSLKGPLELLLLHRIRGGTSLSS